MSATLPQFEIEITPEAMCRWLVGRDGALPDRLPRPGDEVPLSYLFFLRGQPATATSMHRLLGRDPDRGIFGGVRYERSASPTVGDRLLATPEVVERRNAASPRGDLVITTLRTRWTRNGEPAVMETVRMIDLPTIAPAPPAEGADPDPALDPTGAPFSFTRSQIAWLTVATGDLNPLHFDREYAAARLFPDVVVPGTLIAPTVERRLAEAAGKPLSVLDIRFRAPTHPDEAVALSTTAQGNVWSFEIVAEGRMRAAGTAEFAA